MNSTEEINREALTELLSSAGVHAGYEVVPLKGGRNNRVHKIESAGQELFLKAYFYSPADPRDRLHNEFSFTQFAWSNGLRSVPEPIGKLPEHRLALYEFIPGKVANYRPTTMNDIRQATDFVLSVNKYRAGDAARNLPSASEACFSMADHIRNTALRVKRLAKLTVTDDYDAAARQQIDRHLLPLWEEVVNTIDAKRKANPSIDRTLTRDEQWISPSDFGFHNAIETSDGRLRFFDFEYAGWDDPAKLLCDFSNQPDRILEPFLSGSFIREIIASDVSPELLNCRFALLEPLYQIKWACIILNDFLPEGSLRRDFTRSADLNGHKRAQLKKLDTMLNRAADKMNSNMSIFN